MVVWLNGATKKAELLNKFVASVFTMNDGISQTLSSRVTNGEGLSSVMITSFKVFNKLS